MRGSIGFRGLECIEYEEILLACDPGEALEPGDPRYMDLSALRSDVGIRQLKNTRRQRTATGKYHHCLLCGHIGSGKSTELLVLRQWAQENGYLALLDQVNVRFGMVDLNFSDLFLLAASMVDEAIQAHERPALVPKLERMLNWFHDITKEHEDIRQSEIGAEVGAQLEGKTPFSIFKLVAKLTAGIKETTKHTQTSAVQRLPFRVFGGRRTLVRYSPSAIGNLGAA